MVNEREVELWRGLRQHSVKDECDTTLNQPTSLAKLQ